jgi:type VI secretion system protein ImpM
MAPVTGAFGKMPALGDFFRIALPPGFTDPWDAWVQRMMLAARGALGGHWQACYLSAPIWRFTLSAGVSGPWAVQGVLMPSVDRVGREYPLTLAMMRPPLEAALPAHLAADAAFAALEALALDALDDATTRDGLAQALAALVVPPLVSGAGIATLHHDAGQVALNLPHGVSMAGLLAAPDLHRAAIWSSQLAGRDLVMAGNGLLPDRDAVRLFDPHGSFGLDPDEEPA